MMPAGPELDAAVAKAMGLTVLPDGRCSVYPDKTGIDYGGKWHKTPLYSTDAARIPEMLAWLYLYRKPSRPIFNDVRLEASEDGVLSSLWDCCNDARYGTCDHVDEKMAEADGDTIQHALACLVVAVAKAQEGKA